MATTLIQPPPLPSRPLTPPLLTPSHPSLQSEVLSAHSSLQSRLADAITTPPRGVPESLLPTVPLIDLSPSFTSTSGRKTVASHIRAACLTSGFFQISNHGIPASAMNSILTQSKRLFHDLTPAQKDEMHVRHSPLWRGYEPANASIVNTSDMHTGSSETKEGFNFGYEPSLDPTGGDNAYVELDGLPISPGHSNVWPSEHLLPGFKEGVKEYYSQVLMLARHMFKLFALALNLPESYFDKLTTHPGGIGRLMYYPPHTKHTLLEDDSEGELGLGAHTDYECFTLLLAPSPGLEILFPPTPLTGYKPIWRACPVRPGTLTVNVADFLERWTGGLFRSTVHRVVMREAMSSIDTNTSIRTSAKAQGQSQGSSTSTPMSTTKDEGRYSIPFFFSVNYDAEIEPLPGTAGFGKGKGKMKMKAGEYVLKRILATRTDG
jgi:isopenicillin N synthase-like dioxygenase